MDFVISCGPDGLRNTQDNPLVAVDIVLILDAMNVTNEFFGNISPVEVDRVPVGVCCCAGTHGEFVSFWRHFAPSGVKNETKISRPTLSLSAHKNGDTSFGSASQCAHKMSLKSREIRYPKIYSGIRNGAALPIGSPSSTLFLLAFFFTKMKKKVHFRNRRILLEPDCVEFF